MGVSGEDLWMTTKAEEIYPYSVECKNVEKIQIWKAIEQSRIEAKKNGKIPIVVFSKNREETYVALPLKELLDLHRRLRDIDPPDDVA